MIKRSRFFGGFVLTFLLSFVVTVCMIRSVISYVGQMMKFRMNLGEQTSDGAFCVKEEMIDRPSLVTPRIVQI